jgi:hypothetical protein
MPSLSAKDGVGDACVHRSHKRHENHERYYRVVIVEKGEAGGENKAMLG